MIPAPVTKSATTVPGSGIAVGLTAVGEGYMFPKSPGGAITVGSVGGTSSTGSAIDAGGSTSSTGSAIDAGGSTTGSAIDAGGSTTGTSSTGSALDAGSSTTGTSSTGSAMTTGDGWGVGDGGVLPQAGEKFPGPHTNCAEAGGAAAR